MKYELVWAKLWTRGDSDENNILYRFTPKVSENIFWFAKSIKRLYSEVVNKGRGPVAVGRNWVSWLHVIIITVHLGQSQHSKSRNVVGSY